MVLAYFDPNAQREVHVDGCPLRVSATLVQRSPNEDNWRVVQYASRALSNVEQRYSQIKLEMLPAHFACRKFHVFLYGKPFSIFTDQMLDYEFRVESSRIILRGTPFHVGRTLKGNWALLKTLHKFRN